MLLWIWHFCHTFPIVVIPERCSFPSGLSERSQSHLEAIVSCICPYLPSTFFRGTRSARRSAFEHKFQTLCLLRHGKFLFQWISHEFAPSFIHSVSHAINLTLTVLLFPNRFFWTVLGLSRFLHLFRFPLSEITHPGLELNKRGGLDDIL